MTLTFPTTNLKSLGFAKTACETNLLRFSAKNNELRTMRLKTMIDLQKSVCKQTTKSKKYKF